jgi:hypothetical protein
MNQPFRVRPASFVACVVFLASAVDAEPGDAVVVTFRKIPKRWLPAAP